MKILNDGKGQRERSHNWKGPGQVSEFKLQCPGIALSVARHICRGQSHVMMSKDWTFLDQGRQKESSN